MIKTKIKLFLVMSLLLLSLVSTGSAVFRPPICCSDPDPIDPQPDTTPPSVSITSPGDGSTVKDTISISVSASDSGSGMDYVKFKIDGMFLSNDHYSPYSYSLNTNSYSNGEHRIQAIGYDEAGNSRSDTHYVTFDNSVPTVSINSPGSGATLSGTFSISASASDSVSSIDRVKFYVDNTYISTDTTASYSSASIQTTDFTDGSHVLAAVAYDDAGNSRTTTRSVTFVKPPDIKATINRDTITKGQNPTISVTFSNDGLGSSIDYDITISPSVYTNHIDDFEVTISDTVFVGTNDVVTRTYTLSSIYSTADDTYVFTSYGNETANYFIMVQDKTNNKQLDGDGYGLVVHPDQNLAYALIAVDQDFETKVTSVTPFSNTAEFFNWVYTSGARVFDEPTYLETIGDYGSFTEYANGLEDLSGISIVPYVIPTYWTPDYSQDTTDGWYDNLNSFIASQIGLDGVIWDDTRNSHGFDFVIGLSADFDESVDDLWTADPKGVIRGKVIISSYYQDSGLLETKIILQHELGHLFGACEDCIPGESHHDIEGYIMYGGLSSPFNYPYISEWTPWLKMSIDTFDNILNYSW